MGPETINCRGDPADDGPHRAQRGEGAALLRDEVQQVQQHVEQLGPDAAEGKEREVVVVRADQDVPPLEGRRRFVMLFYDAEDQQNGGERKRERGRRDYSTA